MLTYRFGREEKTKEVLQAEGYTCMVTFDAGLMQSEKMQLLQLSPPPGRAKRAMERDFSEALERLKVRERADLDYDAYLSLKTDVSLVALDIETGGREIPTLPVAEQAARPLAKLAAAPSAVNDAGE